MNRGGVLLLLYISIVVVCLLLLETRALAPTLKAKENNHNNDTSDVLERLRGVEQKVYEQGIQLSEYGADIRNLVNIGNEIKKEVKENKIELMTYIDKATSELKNDFKELSNDLNLIKILLLGIIAILSKDNLFDFVVNLFKK